MYTRKKRNKKKKSNHLTGWPPKEMVTESEASPSGLFTEIHDAIEPPSSTWSAKLLILATTRTFRASLKPLGTLLSFDSTFADESMEIRVPEGWIWERNWIRMEIEERREREREARLILCFGVWNYNSGKK